MQTNENTLYPTSTSRFGTATLFMAHRLERMLNGHLARLRTLNERFAETI